MKSHGVICSRLAVGELHQRIYRELRWRAGKGELNLSRLRASEPAGEILSDPRLAEGESKNLRREKSVNNNDAGRGVARD